ncbi:MAG: 2Fe-2S iron-sulfur cluster-binding protein [Pseudomonadota bacterium]|nr:2Fe-2S iron-sulfur cluster-binding protein [Pseudomonadota bacterium]
MTRNFHTMTIAEIQPEIGGAATSVTFNVPNGLAEIFRWHAGQHITLRLLIGGEEYRRSYTISNPPGAPLRITVKRVEGGVVSNHIGTVMAKGDAVEVMPPFGGFFLTPGALARRTHFFFGAGSGITPLFAMINSVLTDEPHSAAHLIYGNADAGSILFKDELDALEHAYPARFSVRHVQSAPSMWTWHTPWRKGRIDTEVIRAALSETPPVAQDVQYWICGPGRMNADVKTALMAHDVPANRIHMESFGGGLDQDTSVKGCAAEAQVTLSGETHQLRVNAGQTLLEAMRTAGLSPPFSCQSGVCGACKAIVTKGIVHMRSRAALEDDEIARGEVLTCQSLPTGDQVVVKFPD